MRRILIPIFFSACAGAGWAHLKPNSLTLSGSGPYHPGDTVTVAWGVDIPHDGINVDFTSNGGKSWTTVKANMAARSGGNYSYKWAVPDSATENGKIRICQKQGSAACRDADTVSRPSGPAPYILVSNKISIATPTALAPAGPAREGHAEGPMVRRIGPGALELTIDLAAETDVAITAYDARGREEARILDRRLPPGSHRLSVFSEALRAHPEWIPRLKTSGTARPTKD
jgi:hypothetical protein